MRIFATTILSVFLLSLNLGCNPANGETNNANANSKPSSIVPRAVPTVAQNEPELWIPVSVEKCIATVSVGETIEPDNSINPYYLRVDFDGDSIMDYAVIIRGSASKKTGVILCRNEQIGSLHGPIAGERSLESEKLGINYITDNWQVDPASEARNPYLSPGKKVKTEAKGEAISFAFEGGAVIYLFWDGRQFRLFDGV